MQYRYASFALLAAYLLAMVILPPLVGFRLDYLWLAQLYVTAAIPALTLPWIIWRRMDPIRPAVEATVVTMMQLPPILTITFVAMRFNLPLADPLLVSMDRAIGFDWPTFVRLVDSSPGASWLLGFAYHSVFYQVVLLPGIVCLLGLPERAFRLVFCYGLLVAVASIIAAFFPSVSAYAGHGFDVGSLRNIDGTNGWLFHSGFHAVRNDPQFVLGPRTANGIVTFPSIHAGVALILTWAAWPTKLRYPLLLMNGLMAIGAITHGAHYLVDVVAALVLAGAVVAASALLVRSPSARCALVPRTVMAG